MTTMAVTFALNPQILKRVPLFSTFTEQQLSAVLAYVQHRRFPRGALIVRSGDETDALYIILSGRVKVLIQDDQGHEC
jgi:CRP/FNR family transcriptional regulator, cyclic AMP receptor protein